MAITIGYDFSSRDDSYEQLITEVEKTNPANASGTIDYIKAGVGGAGSNFMVGSFSASGNDLTQIAGEDTTDLGGQSAGVLEFNAPGDFTAFNIDSGDYIGWYTYWGSLETTGEFWFKGGDYMPCSGETFTVNTSYKLCLYATGTEAGGRTTYNTDAFPLGVNVGISLRM